MRSPLIALCFAALALGCRGEPSQDPPYVGIRNMYDQPKYLMQEESEFFDDGRTMRSPVEHTIAREQEIDPRIALGRIEDDSGYVLTIPPEIIERANGMERLLARGHERYDIYCAPCHGLNGAGEGMVVKRGMQQPPTYHQDRLRHLPDGQIYATIKNGIRAMPSYAAQIPTQDRWAIVSYVRALQLSQAPLAVAPAPTPAPSASGTNKP